MYEYVRVSVCVYIHGLRNNASNDQERIAWLRIGRQRYLLLLVCCLLDRLVGLVVSMSDHEVAGSIPGTSTNFKCGLGLERGPPSASSLK